MCLYIKNLRDPANNWKQCSSKKSNRQKQTSNEKQAFFKLCPVPKSHITKRASSVRDVIRSATSMRICCKYFTTPVEFLYNVKRKVVTNINWYTRIDRTFLNCSCKIIWTFFVSNLLWKLIPGNYAFIRMETSFCFIFPTRNPNVVLPTILSQLDSIQVQGFHFMASVICPLWLSSIYRFHQALDAVSTAPVIWTANTETDLLFQSWRKSLECKEYDREKDGDRSVTENPRV